MKGFLRRSSESSPETHTLKEVSTSLHPRLSSLFQRWEIPGQKFKHYRHLIFGSRRIFCAITKFLQNLFLDVRIDNMSQFQRDAMAECGEESPRRSNQPMRDTAGWAGLRLRCFGQGRIGLFDVGFCWSHQSIILGNCMHIKPAVGQSW